MSSERQAREAAEIVRDAGGNLVGRTRLQKVAYLLTVAGLENEFSFLYKHYGPYSEDLAQAAKTAQALGLIREDEHAASWGGTYSVYQALHVDGHADNAARLELATLASKADAVELELAATAAYLAVEEGIAESWAETARRKPEKAEGGRLERAKKLYEEIRKLNTPQTLPELQ